MRRRRRAASSSRPLSDALWIDAKAQSEDKMIRNVNTSQHDIVALHEMFVLLCF